MNTLNLNAYYQNIIETESKMKTHYVQLFLRFYEIYGIRFAASMFKMAQYCPDAIEEMYQYLRKHTNIPSIEEYEKYDGFYRIHSLNDVYHKLLFLVKMNDSYRRILFFVGKSRRKRTSQNKEEK